VGYTVRHTIETDVDGFWKLFMDQDVSRAMMKDFGGGGSYDIVDERVDEHGAQLYRIEYAFNVPLPGFIKKLVGDGSYTEHGRYDPALKKYSARCVPKVNGDKMTTTFEITAVPLGSGERCERVIAVENTVKVFGVGGLIETFLERVQREAHGKAAEFTNRWIRSNGA